MHVGALDLEVIEQAARVLRHHGRTVVLGRIELGAFPVTAVVVGDDAIAGRGQHLDPAGTDPVGRDVGGEPVDEEHRVAALGALVDEGDFDAVGIERPHLRRPSRRRALRRRTAHPYHFETRAAMVAARCDDTQARQIR